ncbi:MAG TPA: tRNA (N(6)-L-threonylcarbamoyladenosine(37)-C(2))-methylthiotransferase MtaB [Pirellulaceae bacterium]|nr:tRNA (N(6)-L-threonylcarbamoyladenosine(37)-C(2))-methylthiotransferase MtaB [Pirellulaceae bacterium]HMO91079.1 tRNA (N(6)-L-threonylcarbamoyladenosine(37)-C(2))-methylthiotransferase MtaB [Pirellulaceae bacterium]HMP71178.1 tRNA (N(6)-L-threonylcarbamoyladenosine(37)-C(2))-methylthiotransferase MtaB [Pirellulaceae bacterium]
MTGILKTVTLGCKVNQYETEYLREGLNSVGFRDAVDGESADLCIVNTCTVTAEGDAKSRQVIRKMHRANPAARIIVMGCYATRAPQDIHQLPGVAEVVTDKRELPDMLARFGVIDIPNGISGLHGRHRAYVKVQDGCLLKCSYCIIPYVRPNFQSRPTADILAEVQRMVDSGYREVILTGIHLGHYGVDFNHGKKKTEWVRLSTLVDRIAQLPGDFRVRLSSIECTEVTRELLDVMRQFPNKIAPHLHVCLQSGSDKILRGMRRRWSVQRILDRCQLIKQTLYRPALTTDVIVGFPGESADDFQDTVDVCREIGFSKIHVFPFSARRGTPAAEFPDQVTNAVKASRVQVLTQVESELKRAYLQSLVGQRLQVLVEEVAAGVSAGTSCRYVRVQFPAANDALQTTGILRDVTVKHADDSSLYG